MCTTFRDKVISTKEFYTCKHVLAARLAVLLGKVKVEAVKDDVFGFSLRMIKPMSTNSSDE